MTWSAASHDPMRMTSYLVALSLATFLTAQNDAPKQEPKAETPAAPPAPRSAQEMLKKYSPAAGPAKVGSVAEVKLGDGWLWLDGGNARRFLTDLGNQPGSSILGVAIPPDFAAAQSFAVYTTSTTATSRTTRIPTTTTCCSR